MSRRANLFGTAIVTGARKRLGEIIPAVITRGVTTGRADLGAGLQPASGIRRFTMVTEQEAVSVGRLTITALETAILKSGDGEFRQTSPEYGKGTIGFFPGVTFST
jgi:hypothetical protein